MTRELVQEIIAFHETVNETLISNRAVGCHDQEVDFDMVTAKVEDEVFAKYKIEFEDIVAFCQASRELL